MEDNNQITETKEPEAIEAKPQLSLDELLKDPKIQAEFDKKAEGMKKKWEASWQKKSEEEKIEAEKLARMTEDEKHQVALNKAIDAQQRAEKELNAYKLKEEANKIAREREMDPSLLDILDYGSETAESVKSKIDMLDAVYKKAVEKGVNEKLKQPSPKNVVQNVATTERAYLDNKYKNNPYYKKG